MLKEKKNKRIVLAGGPSTGKTSVLNELKKFGYMCFDEAARDILLQYSSEGSSFKLDPIKISNEILIKRDYDFNKALNVSCKNDIVFFDRGVHEITAYLRSIAKSTSYWEELPKNYKYDMVFIFPSWKDIYIKDNSRIEDYEDAMKISPLIYQIYDESSILIVEVPNTSINKRVDFILNNI
tara:strand:+ start:1250 stop:1792 length:543 start_codon:yes stop_codon:yes gene_type:complete